MLNLYARTPVDVEERTITLQGDDRTIGSVLDTLTSSCMQCAAACSSQVHPRVSCLPVRPASLQRVSRCNWLARLVALSRRRSTHRMVELLKTSDTSTDRDQEVAEALSALLNGNGNKKRASVRILWPL